MAVNNSRNVQNEILIENNKMRLVTLLMAISVGPLLLTILIVSFAGMVMAQRGMDGQTNVLILLGVAIILAVLFGLMSWAISRRLIK